VTHPRPAALRSREDLHALLGVTAPLETVPHADLAPTTGTVDGVRVARLELWLPGGRRVPCLVLTPAGPGPWPGVVAVHQHNNEFHLGKSEPAGLTGAPDLAYGLALARAGTLVVAPDLLGFEERRGALPDGGDQERLMAFHLVARGSSLQAQHVQDVALCVTWLQAQPEVSGGIGVIGHSLGGQVAFFAAACDARVRAAVISCGLGTVASFHLTSTLHNPAWYVPGILPAGDSPAVAALAHDQHFWVSAGRADPLFPLSGVHEAVAALPRDSTTLRLFDGGHGFPPDLLDEAVDWLGDRLGG
jgi:dienelactone hydrolase